MRIEKSQRICAFCELCIPVFDSDTMLCEKHGIVAKDYKCKKFSYDPLKRVPPKAQTAPTLDYIDIDD